MELQERAEKLREKAAEKKMNENMDDTKKRLLKAVEKRDLAVGKINKYKDKFGDPTDDEIDNNFLKNEAKIDLNLEEFKEKENEE